MDNIAIMMFGILGFVLLFALYQTLKTKKQLPEDTSDIQPGMSLQKMDRDKERD
ncbi:MAG: hypothetical protein WBA51_12525 [Erythrobacter sp.]